MDKFQTVKIENFSSSGDGIAKINGQVVFVENALPDETVKIEITKENKNFVKAKILEITEPSKNRVKPFCPLYNACGACSLQHANYTEQLKLKKIIVQDAMKNIGGLDIEVQDTVPSPEILHFRCKIQYPTSQTKVSKRVLAGYFKSKTHEIVNIKHCPLQPEICDEIVEFIRNNINELKLTCYNEKSKHGLIRHIVIRHSFHTKENLVTIVINDNKVSSQIKSLCENIYNNFSDISGVCVNFNNTKSNLILSDKSELIIGKPTIDEKIIDKIFKIGSTTFFQVNPQTAENIFEYVKEIIKKTNENPYILDAYAGIASFGIIVSDVAQKVVSIESNKASTDLALEVVKNNNIKNVEIVNADTAKFIKNLDEKFDVIILDPPRKGCVKTTLDEVLRLASRQIIYVSCNPATLARDLKYLCQNGAKVVNVKPFDMFCHTLHVETVATIIIN